MTSPLTGATLTAQRANNRWKRYYCAVVSPNSIFTARVNQTFTSFDGVNKLIYDGGTGTYTDVKSGMTCWIGSAAGLCDIGIVRVRKALTTTYAYIGKVSGLQLADNQYLTFFDEFGLWQKEPVITDVLTLVDEDVPWTAVQAGAPIVRIGPPAVVLQLTGATVAVTWTAPTIYSPTGTTAASYAWTAPGASATANLTTSTPTFTYNAAGTYYIRLALTDSAGGVTYVTRRVLVSPASVPVTVSDLSGDIDSGGWSASIEGYSSVDIASLRDRAMVVLWKADYVSTAADTQYGLYPDCENIRMIGWIDGESITQNPEFGTASFTVHGPAYWLDRIPGAPYTITDATAASWDTVASLNADKALYRLVRWHSTLSEITDVTLTGDTTRVKIANVNTGSLRQQIDQLAGDKLLAKLACDRFGCAYVSIPQSLLDSTGKNALTVLWDTSSSDWIEQIEIARNTSQSASQMEIGGSGYDGATETEYWSRAPGNTPSRYGAVQAPYSTLALGSQTIANRFSGDVLADANREYPTVDIVLSWANDFIDIAPSYIVRISLAAADTPRGITWTTKRFIPQAISYEFDPQTGVENTLITLAEETTGYAGVTYYPPNPSMPIPPLPGPIPFPIPGPGIWFPPVVPPTPPGSGCGVSAPANSFPLIWDKTKLADGESAKAYFPCRLRPSGHTNGPSYISLQVNYDEMFANSITCYALGATGARLVTGSVSAPAYVFWSPTTITFSVVSETDVWGFEIVAHTTPRDGAAITATAPIMEGVYTIAEGAISLIEATANSLYYQFTTHWKYESAFFRPYLKIHLTDITCADKVWLVLREEVTGTTSTFDGLGAPWTAFTQTGSGRVSQQIGAAVAAVDYRIDNTNAGAVGTEGWTTGFIWLIGYAGTPVPTYVYLTNISRIYNVCPNESV